MNFPNGDQFDRCTKYDANVLAHEHDGWLDEAHCVL